MFKTENQKSLTITGVPIFSGAPLESMPMDRINI